MFNDSEHVIHSVVDILLGIYLYVSIGIPQPVRLQAAPSNTSVALRWELPGPDEQAYLYFNVSFYFS